MVKTFATSLFRGTYWLLVGVVAYLILVFIVPSLDNPEAAAFLPVFGAFLVVLVVGAVIATRLRPSPRRRWLWLALVVPPILILLANAPYLPYSLVHPADPGFQVGWPLLLATLILVIAGIRVYREAGAATVGAWDGRARLTVSALAGLVIGLVVSGSLASATAGDGGGTLAAAPTISDSLVMEDTSFAPATYAIASGEVLGLFVENRDSIGHSFDIDALDIHVPLPPNSTVAVAVQPVGPGQLAFYCAVPGHAEAGMTGTIDVE
ncbi:MAG TPA: cupredoxin domain-containing protein [Candidatus Limnocylindrales bacterium]|nr:cupredoxin domain-containing protein [Candidatus Limnocylindrales bacterium]